MHSIRFPWTFTGESLPRSTLSSRKDFPPARLVSVPCRPTRYELKSDSSEKASIDEAFIDFTWPVREKILERYPYLNQVPPDAPNGIDTPLPPPPPISWEGRGTLVPINPNIVPPEGTAEDDCEGDGHEEDDEMTTWHDLALSIAAELMDKIRADVRDTLGYTTSAVSAIVSLEYARAYNLMQGIARNKFLAKVKANWALYCKRHDEISRIIARSILQKT